MLHAMSWALIILVGLSNLPCISARITSHPKLFPAPAGDSIAGESESDVRYIVVLTRGVSTLSNIRGYSDKYMKYKYDAVLNGYAIERVPDDVMKAILDSDTVKAVYEDSYYYGIPVEAVEGETTQTGATWGIDRVDSRVGLDGTYNYEATGAGVTIFVMDTGLRGTHNEFTGRFLGCTDYTGEGCSNPALHGTHVAGTSLGTTYGVAKGASLFDLKVLQKAGSGTLAGIIAAFNDVAAMKLANPAAKYVINASLGGGFSSALNQAVNDCVDTGVVVVVAAGNDDVNACTQSPSSATKAITVGSTTTSDTRSYFSNFGTCVDVFAPGSDITSASDTSDTSTSTISGTSMASPHVAGIAAMYLELGLDPFTDIVNLATPNVVNDPGTGSPNLLAYNGFDLSPVAPTTMAPTQTPTQRPTLACDAGFSLFSLDLLTDNYGSEISWDLVNDCTGTTIASGSSYASDTAYVEEACYEDARVTFTLYDSASDGICCSFGQGSYSIFKDSVLIRSGGEYAGFESTSFGTCPTGTLAPTSSPTMAGTIECPSGTSPFQLELFTDRYPSETTWELRNSCDSTLIMSGGGSYAGSTLYIETACLDNTAGHSFVIFDSFADGICCFFGNGYYNLEYNGVLIRSGGDFSGSETTDFGSCPSTSAPSPAPPAECGSGTSEFSLELLTDQFPSETTWELRDSCDSTLITSGGSYSLPETLYVETACIDNSRRYSFSIFDAFGDGICCDDEVGYYTVTYDGALIEHGGRFNEVETTEFGGPCPTPSPTASPVAGPNCAFTEKIGQAFSGFVHEVQAFIAPGPNE